MSAFEIPVQREQCSVRRGAAGRLEPLPLESGDRLTRAEFERRYAAIPHVKKAELIEGMGSVHINRSSQKISGNIFHTTEQRIADHALMYFVTQPIQNCREDIHQLDIFFVNSGFKPFISDHQRDLDHFVVDVRPAMIPGSMFKKTFSMI